MHQEWVGRSKDRPSHANLPARARWRFRVRGDAAERATKRAIHGGIEPAPKGRVMELSIVERSIPEEVPSEERYSRGFGASIALFEVPVPKRLGHAGDRVRASAMGDPLNP